MENILANIIIFAICCCLPTTLIVVAVTLVGFRMLSKGRKDIVIEQRRVFIKALYPHVVKALDEFGKQKWGIAGKRKNYKVYYGEAFLEDGFVEWYIVSNMGTLSHKYSTETENYYKFPSYRVTLSFNDEAPWFNIRYGGYETEGEGANRIDAEASREELIQALNEILDRGYEPWLIHSFNLVPDSHLQLRQVL